MEEPELATIYDVVIVGAGIAGLTAARELTRAGRKVLIVEARDRVGGRIHTIQSSEGHPVELGATWVGPDQHEVLAMLTEYNIPLRKNLDTGKNVQYLDKKRSEYKGTVPPISVFALIDMANALRKLDKATNKINLSEPWMSPKAGDLDKMTAKEYLNSIVWLKSVRSTVEIAIRTIFGCEDHEISALYFLWVMKSGVSFLKLASATNGAQQDSILPGSITLPNAVYKEILDKGCHVHLSEPVEHIDQTDKEVVTIRTGKGQYKARFCVMAMPPSLSLKMRYSPLLPPAKDQLAQNMPMGAVLKTITIYENPFWLKAGYSGQTISDLGPVCATYDHSEEDIKFYAIIGFVNGKHAIKWRQSALEERKKAVFEEYAMLWKSKEALTPKEYIEMDWTTEEFSRGCYFAHMTPGSMTEFGRELNTPFDRVHWACTECATNNSGYMDGAIQSGKRAAENIHALLK
jgi:monoamine oxidase